MGEMWVTCHIPAVTLLPITDRPRQRHYEWEQNGVVERSKARKERIHAPLLG